MSFFLGMQFDNIAFVNIFPKYNCYLHTMEHDAAELEPAGELDDVGEKVIGLTLIGDRLFVLHWPNENRSIRVYNTTTSQWEVELPVRDFDDSARNGLTSCARNSCLYVSCKERSILHKVQIEHTEDLVVAEQKWPVNCANPVSLSVTPDSNLLVTCETSEGFGSRLMEYTSAGDHIRTISLDCLHTKFVPVYALLLPDADGHYIVSFQSVCEDDHSVYEMKVLESPNETYVTSEPFKLLRLCKDPRQIAAINSEHVLVADCLGDSIVVLNRSSETVKVYGDVEKWAPRCLCIDDSGQKLYVGSYCIDGGIISVFNIGYPISASPSKALVRRSIQINGLSA